MRILPVYNLEKQHDNVQNKTLLTNFTSTIGTCKKYFTVFLILRYIA